MDAIYARQSVDRADSISIESQIEFCQYETRGNPYKAYIDRGYSGKNTERPGFQQMMSDMAAGLISRVIVYKLDRISRSILDFSSMMETFGTYHVEFVSTTEKFDTSSPMGRAMLNICIVFAQLERETIQKRVADAYFARSQKGLYMGGRLPYGYRLVPTVIGGIRTSMYEAVPEEAEIIRLMYQMYADPECSYGDIVRSFQAQGITKRGKPWVRTRAADILRNPIYVRADLAVCQFYQEQGVAPVNPPPDFAGINGCYCYRGKEGDYLVLAPHEGIVPAELWLRCRRKGLSAKQPHPHQKAKNTWLAGKIKCGICGYALVDKHYAKSGTRYLFCSHRTDSKACPGPGTIRTGEIEALVYAELRKKLACFPLLRPPEQGPADPKRIALKLEQGQIQAEINTLLERLAGADDVMFRYISQRIAQLDSRRQSLQEEISACGPPGGGEPVTCHLTVWEELSFSEKRQVADQLIQVICATSDTLQIQWRI